MPRYSVIVPFYNAHGHLPRVLSGLAGLGSEWEVIVVNDRSNRHPGPDIASLLPGARCLDSSRPRGAAGARNHGAQAARGEVLFFLDSDVWVKPETLMAMARTLEQDSELTGVFGCYSREAPPEHSALSRFRNLLHRYVHRQCAGEVDSFWTGLGAVRRLPFQASGGFDESLGGGASIEDVEFGARLSRAGHRLLLDPRFEGIHLKSWELGNLVKTDLFHRAVPWTKLLLQGRIAWSTLNGGWRFRIGPLLLLLATLLTVIGSPYASLVALAYFTWIAPQCLWIASEGGMGVALVTPPALMLHHGCCCVGAFLGLLPLQLTPSPSPEVASQESHEPQRLIV